MITPENVLSFWIDEVGPAGWYKGTPELDAEIRERFAAAWEQARSGALEQWLLTPRGALAFLVLTDQFPRNMFRDTARAFATDELARAVAKQAIRRGFDLRIEPPARQFFYLPLMHSECLCDQERCVGLMLERMGAEGNNLLHARAHREIIRRFGRFPYRNAALDRRNTAPEEAFLAGSGYGAILSELQRTAV